MEFVISKSEFLKGLGRIQSIIERKTALPILTNVLLEASEGSLQLVATDLEVGIKGQYTAEVKSGGTITVSARKLHEVVRELPEDSVHFKVLDNDWVKITSGKANFRMVGLSADDFPILPSFENEDFATLPVAFLGDMIDMVSYAISTDETRYSLNGVFITVTENDEGLGLRLVATDGHRLSLVERSLPEGVDLPADTGVIVPRKGINELKKLFGEGGEGDMELCFKDRNMIVKRDNLLYIIRLIDGEFPDYDQVIPKANDKHVTVSRDLLAAAMRRCSLFSMETTHGVKLDINDKNMEIQSSDPNLGEAQEEMPVIYQGEPLTIGFNSRYFTDVLAVIKDEDVHIEFAEALAPGLIKAPSEPGFLAVIMPMRL